MELIPGKLIVNFGYSFIDLNNLTLKYKANIASKTKIPTLEIKAGTGISIPANIWKTVWVGSIIPIIKQIVSRIDSKMYPIPLRFFNKYMAMKAAGLIIPISNT